MNVILSASPVRLILSSLRASYGAALIEHRNASDAYRFLQVRATCIGLVPQLRDLLTNAGQSSLAAHENVLYAAAISLAAKETFLLQMEPVSAGVTIDEVTLPVPAESKRSPVTSLPPPPPSGRRMPEKSLPDVDVEPTNARRQDQQAQSLKAAAESGAPVCAVSEQAENEQLAAK